MPKPRRLPAFPKSTKGEWRDCDQCFGHGEDICSECEGEGCAACQTRGYTVCRICHGSGEVQGDAMTWIAVQS